MQKVDTLCGCGNVNRIGVEDVVGGRHPEVEILCALGADDVLPRQKDKTIAMKSNVADGITDKGGQWVTVLISCLTVFPHASLKDKAAIALAHKFMGHGGRVKAEGDVGFCTFFPNFFFFTVGDVVAPCSVAVRVARDAEGVAVGGGGGKEAEFLGFAG